MTHTIFITGGAGFIGTNTALHFASRGHKIIVLDDLSRPGVESNLTSLKQQIPDIQFIHADIADTHLYERELSRATAIIHLAGQTAVTTSLTDPVRDYHTNVYGTFRLLELVRRVHKSCPLLYSSTNKVYGDLHTHRLHRDEMMKRWIDQTTPSGIDEREQLDFLSPYGVSKGSADQYVKDWAHSYGLKTVVLRQSCIYGPYQMGVEDQGWVAHFSKLALTGSPITIYGDGYQVRDLLHVSDLVRAYEMLIARIDEVAGHVYNIGGGVTNTHSVLNVLELLQTKIPQMSAWRFAPERLADQKYFVSANTSLKASIGWEPHVQFEEGIDTLLEWQRAYLKI